jgi:hypothetical protein
MSKTILLYGRHERSFPSHALLLSVLGYRIRESRTPADAAAACADGKVGLVLVYPPVGDCDERGRVDALRTHAAAAGIPVICIARDEEAMAGCADMVIAEPVVTHPRLVLSVQRFLGLPEAMDDRRFKALLN